MDNAMIRLEGVTKEYRMGVINQKTLREEMSRFGARLMHGGGAADATDRGERFNALSDLSFEVRAGEALGILGHNGAGKSTLLKLISKITRPTSGKIYLDGRVASMIEVGTGFHPELTGRENIYINGAILGMSKREIDRKLDGIISFSECEQFIDTPVKRYSSGMYLKLGFAVATQLDAEIVIMDEVLAVGDVAFQNKCIQKMQEVAASGRTILYVSHNMRTVRSLCSRCIVLDHGRLTFDGDVEAAIQEYTSVNFYRETSRLLKDLPRLYPTEQRALLEYIALSGGKNVLTMGDRLRFTLRWRALVPFDSLRLRVGVWSADGIAAAIAFAELPSTGEGLHESNVCLDTSALVPGKYSLELLLIEADQNGQMVKQDVMRGAITFEIRMHDDRPHYRAYHRDWGYSELSMTVDPG